MPSLHFLRGGVLAAAFILSFRAIAVNWDPAQSTPLSVPGALGLDIKSYKLIDAKGNGDAMAIWFASDPPPINSGIKWKSRVPNGVWVDGTAFTETNANTFFRSDFDASMNTNRDYIVAGVLRNFESGEETVVVDIVINGIKIAEDFTVVSRFNYPLSVKAVISGNTDTLIVWKEQNQLTGRIRRGGVWQQEIMIASTDIRSWALAADDTGNFTVVWNPDVVGAELGRIYARRFTGGAWQATELIGQNEGGAQDQFPRVGMHGNGNVIVAWWHNFQGYNGFLARRYNGSAWLGQETIDAGQSAGNSHAPPAIAVQQDGKATVMFQQGGDGQANGRIFANRFVNDTWQGPIEIGCGIQGGSNLGYPMTVDMDGNGNTIAAYQTGAHYLFRLYLEGLGWLACSGQGFNGHVAAPMGTPEGLDKKIVLTPHEIVGAWPQYPTSPNGEGGTLYGNQGRKEVWINGTAMQTSSPVVDLQIRMPFNDLCNTNSPVGFQEMRFSNDGVQWSSWEPAPITPPYIVVKTGWDITSSTYGGTAAAGLKRVFIQFRNANCSSLVTHDEIWYRNGTVTGFDAGLRIYSGTEIIRIACDTPTFGGTLLSAVRFSKNGTNYGIVLTDTNSPSASKVRVQTSSGTKAWMKLP